MASEKTVQPETLRYSADAGNAELSALCGPLDENLRQIETILNVRVSRRGDVFRVTGELEAARRAVTALAALMTRVKSTGEELSVDDIQWHFVGHDDEYRSGAASDPEGAVDDVDLKVRRRDLQGRTPNQRLYLKAIMGQIDFEGEIRIGHNVRIGYFAQNEASGLDESITVFKTVDDIAVGDIRTRIRDILGAFMFGKEASEKLVKVLSGGERTRLAMIKLLLEPVNLLILDEPTNHLDLKTKEILKEALMAFDGTLIVVSHDRDFLDGLTSKIYEFSHGRVTEHLDGVYGFLRKKKIENISEIERRKA